VCLCYTHDGYGPRLSHPLMGSCGFLVNHEDELYAQLYSNSVSAFIIPGHVGLLLISFEVRRLVFSSWVSFFANN
jgi:hypothetical protein